MKRQISNILIIFLLTVATIIFEISISRLFSYMLSYHFVLIIIAFSILGLGVGQIIFAKHFKGINKYLTRFYGLLPGTMFASFLLLLLIPKLALFSSTNAGLFAFIGLAILPFIAIGIIHAQIIEDGKTAVSLLYGVDLLGAATGALVSVFLLNALNLVLVVLIAILLLFLAFILHLSHNQYRWSGVLLVGFLAILPLLWFGKERLVFDITIFSDASKDMLRLMSNPSIESEIIESRWNSFGKTDLVNITYPDGTESQVMFIDGAAGTDVINIDDLLMDSTKLIRELGGFPALFAMNFLDENQTDTALVIGPGGGIDIAAAWFKGFGFIEAVEVNPSFVHLMEAYNSPTFVDKKNIKVQINEGRNFVQSQKGKYDAILLTIPVTKSSRGADFYGLTENYLFTVEALSDYLEGLTSEGSLFFTMHGKHEVYKMLSNYLKLQEKRGIDAEAAFKQVYIVSNGMNPILVIKNGPFDTGKVNSIHFAAHEYGLDQDVFFVPYVNQMGIDTLVNKNVNYAWFMFDELLYGISSGKISYNEISEASLMNLNPVYDDSPYFFNYNKGIPDSMLIPQWLAIFIIGWFVFRSTRGWDLVSNNKYNSDDRRTFNLLAVLIFVLGFSYFFIQAYMFQILNLKLSSPSQSFSLLLFTFLLGNGLGSFLTRMFKENLAQKLVIYIFVIIIANLLTVYLVLPSLDPYLTPTGIALTLLLPSFFIGVPFPVILKIAARLKYKNAIPFLLAISSVAGVAASVFAILISILYGYEIVFIAGLGCYALIIGGAIKLDFFERQSQPVLASGESTKKEKYNEG